MIGLKSLFLALSIISVITCFEKDVRLAKVLLFWPRVYTPVSSLLIDQKARQLGDHVRDLLAKRVLLLVLHCGQELCFQRGLDRLAQTAPVLLHRGGYEASEHDERESSGRHTYCGVAHALDQVDEFVVEGY